MHVAGTKAAEIAAFDVVFDPLCNVVGTWPTIIYFGLSSHSLSAEPPGWRILVGIRSEWALADDMCEVAAWTEKGFNVVRVRIPFSFLCYYELLMSLIDTVCSFTMAEMEKVGFKSLLNLDKTRRHCLSGFKFPIWSLLRVFRCDIVLRPARIQKFKGQALR